MQRITLPQLMTKMAALPREIDTAVLVALRKSAVEVQKTAQEKFGEYQPAFGDYPAWPLLTINTLHQKMDLAGSPGPDPLVGHYPPGESKKLYPTSLRQSISIEVSETEMAAAVGTNNPIGKWQEFGTDRGIPPRPFLRPALHENEDYIVRAISEAIGMALFSRL